MSAPKLSPVQLRVLQYLGAPGMGMKLGRLCVGFRLRSAAVLHNHGLAQLTPGTNAMFTITQAGLDYLATLEPTK